MKLSNYGATIADSDPTETQEWIDSMSSVTSVHGPERAQFLLRQLEEVIRNTGFTASGQPFSAYRNSISVDQQMRYPGNLELEERITAINRWNALVMVMRANKAYGGLGGHIASYASAAEIFETGFNHFFRAATKDFAGDLIYFQPHSAPGVYARAYLEGRLSEEQLSNYRQEVGGNGLCSYPHPWLMPDFWQFPTGSMGIGPLNAVYQARYMRYLEGRGLASTEGRHVWGVFGDGEMDEPESIAGLTLAAREGLDNLTFIVNCNLQRLDGPVRGNGQIIQELESLFVGAGWNVIKVLWGSEWDSLFARDTDQVLLRRFAETVDGEYQDLGSKDGDYNRAKFFDTDPATQRLVEHMTDAEINQLKRGGHDLRKLYAAYAAAKSFKGKPTVILAKTKKGFGMGGAGESRMSSHQAKSLDMEALTTFRDRFSLPLTNDDLENLHFYKPKEGSPELNYLRQKREALGGSVPARNASKASSPEQSKQKGLIPEIESYAKFALQANNKSMSTTMAAVRMLGGLLKDKTLGPKVVPIVADEARTFGMDNLFRQIGIYSPLGQLYEPEDAGSMMFYKEAKNGQLLEEGINEAGAISSWAAAATSYSVHNVPTLPFYIYYSMFGFQRVGDLIWAAADQRARGFLLGATAGRTTLSGEGLQHQDGSSHLIASTIPNCRAYDPAYAYELAIIMQHGMQQMMERDVDEFYYITVMNENYAQPSIPGDIKNDVLRGLYKLHSRGNDKNGTRVRLIGSGTILNEVIAAADILLDTFNISSDIFSATSFTELAKEARTIERQNRLYPAETQRYSHLQECLPGNMPIIAATDYVAALPHLVAPYLDARFVALGTDGFGRSDQRSVLREFFEVDRKNIALAAIESLVRLKLIDPTVLTEALKQFEVGQESAPPWTL
ncbi:MAG: Pyruvate dehydrogenase E1 component [Porticoccaceae bacterium UBA1117]|nr:MAG: Pyruvate dehydrogenase E1 component [Porticoccaceae bacterium UBA1117]